MEYTKYSLLKEIENKLNKKLKDLFKKDIDLYIEKKNILEESYKKEKISVSITLGQTICEVEDISPDKLREILKEVIEPIQNEKNQKIFFFSQDEISNLEINKKVIFVDFFPVFLYSLPEDRIAQILEFTVFFVENPKIVKNNIGISEEDYDQKIFNLYKNIFISAINSNASDIHIIPKINKYIVFFRIDGIFYERKEFQMLEKEGDALVTFLLRSAGKKTKGRFNPDNKMIAQDAKIVIDDIPEVTKKLGYELDVRLVFIPDGVTFKNMSITIRLLYKRVLNYKNGEIIQEILNLGYENEDANVLINIMQRRNGIMVISGITNSGKSTLATTLLNTVNQRKIGTIEDPIEFVLTKNNITQHQVFITDDEKTTMDFENYVKAFKRGDYDVVFIGEWRKHKGLTEAIIEQAYAGQLILTTLHIPTSFHLFESLEKLFNISADYILPVLLLSFNQCLLPRLCSKCKIKLSHEKYETIIKSIIKDLSSVSYLSYEDIQKFLSVLENFQESESLFEKGPGCEYCNGIGYKGRTVVYDYFLPSYEVSMILSKENRISPYNLIKLLPFRKIKLQTFLDKAQKGEIDINHYKLVI